MGCDIHAYIEYKASRDWFSFGGDMDLGRHYGIFSKLCGVRNYHDIIPLSEPRGLPKDISFSAESDNEYYITKEKTSSDRSCTEEEAAAWVKSGSSRYTNSDKNHVTCPDWHSHSWVTPDELKEVLSNIDIKKDPSWSALLNCLQHFESIGCEARLVFWFDN